jgi:hypothetical protein
VIPARSFACPRTRSVNSGRAATHLVEPRRVATRASWNLTISREPKIAKKYRDAARCESDAGSPAAETAGQWAVGICTTKRRCYGGTGTEVFTVRCGQVSPRFRGQGLDCVDAHVDSWRPVVRRPCSRAIAALMSTTGL